MCAQQVVGATAAEVTSPATEAPATTKAPASTEKAKKKDAAAVPEAAQVATSPAGPSTQDAAQEVSAALTGLHGISKCLSPHCCEVYTCPLLTNQQCLMR